MGKIVVRTAVWQIVAAYAAFSGLWIYLSDTIMGWIIQDRALIIQLSIYNHEGNLSVSSAPGAGTTFTIHLPASGTAETTPVTARAVRMGSGRVLVVDDEEAVLGVGAEILSYLGYEAVCARNGGETLELYSKGKKECNPFIAVISDLTIPGGMGGREMVDLLREFDPEGKVIVSSGYSNNPIMSESGPTDSAGSFQSPTRLKRYPMSWPRCWVEVLAEPRHGSLFQGRRVFAGRRMIRTNLMLNKTGRFLVIK